MNPKYSPSGTAITTPIMASSTRPVDAGELRPLTPVHQTLSSPPPPPLGAPLRRASGAQDGHEDAAELAGEAPFDLVFIDADKDGYPEYLAWAIRLSRPGTVIVADNCLMGGSGLRSPDEPDGQHLGARATTGWRAPTRV